MRWLPRLFLPVTFLIFSATANAAPQIVFQQGNVVALPDQHLPPVKEQLEIIEQEKCVAQKSGRKIVVNGNCSFLRGLYRYAFFDKENKSERTLFLEFTVFRSGGGHAFISAAPLELVSN